MIKALTSLLVLIAPLSLPVWLPVSARSQDLSPLIPFVVPSRNEVQKIVSAVIETNRGKILFELYPDTAPLHVANFKYLSEIGFYSGQPINNIIADHVLQAGLAVSQDSRSRYSLPPEFSKRHHVRGTVGMARDTREPAAARRFSSPTQFHIVLSENPRMDGDYTIFGRVIDGMAVVERLQVGDRIEELTVYVLK